MALARWMRSHAAHVFVVGAVIVLVVLLYLAYYVAPTHFAPHLSRSDLNSLSASERLAAKDSRIATQNGIRTTSLQLVGGIAVLGGAIAAWVNISIRHRGLNLSREGQITERFNKAVEHVGHGDSLDIRLGGIHALARIAADSPADRHAVTDVLAAFVRAKAVPGNAVDGTSQLAAPIVSNIARFMDSGPSVDALAAMRALGTLSSHEDGNRLVVDLRHVVMRGASFDGQDYRKANLELCDFDGAELLGVDLTNAKLNGARFCGALIQGSTLVRAVLRNCDLSGSKLIATDFTGADLSRASFGRVHIQGSNFTGARFTQADLSALTLGYGEFARAVFNGANLREANLYRGRLSEAHFIGADLTAADLRGADLSGGDARGAALTGARLSPAVSSSGNERPHTYERPANLRSIVLLGANLRKADLRGAQLMKADLRKADLSDADLTGADLTEAKLEGATIGGSRRADVKIKGASLPNGW